MEQRKIVRARKKLPTSQSSPSIVDTSTSPIESSDNSQSTSTLSASSVFNPNLNAIHWSDMDDIHRFFFSENNQFRLPFEPIEQQLKSIIEYRNNSLFSRDVSHLVYLLDKHHQNKNQPLQTQTSQIDSKLNTLKKKEQETVDMIRIANENGNYSAEQKHAIDHAILERNNFRKEVHLQLQTILQNYSKTLENISQQSDSSQEMQEYYSRVSQLHQNQVTPLNHDPINFYFQIINHFFKQIQSCSQETNNAVQKLQEALNKELRLKTQMSEILSNCQQPLIEKLIQMTSQSLQDYQSSFSWLNNLRELESVYQKEFRRLDQDLQVQNQIPSLGFKWEQIKQKLKEAKKNHLKLKYKKEELVIDGMDISGINAAIQAAQMEVNTIEQELQQMQSKICNLNSFPELQLPFSKGLPNLNSQISNMEIVHRQFSDYEIIENLNTKVFKVRFGTQLKILKKFDCSDEIQSRKFQREMVALSKLNHPCIAKVDGFFREFVQDKCNYFVQLQYYSEENLLQWLQRYKPNKRLIKQTFYLIAQALKHLHDKNILHCDIKMENIVMQKMNYQSFSLLHSSSHEFLYKPILIDFDVSKDLESIIQRRNTTIHLHGTFAYAAPELLNSTITLANMHEVYTPALDWYAFGLMLFKTVFTNAEPVLLPNSEGIQLPYHEDALLLDLLKNLLFKDPKKRFSGEDALSHPFFTSSMNEDEMETTDISTCKLKAFSRFLHMYTQNLKSKVTQRVTYKIRRTQLVKDVLEIFSKLQVFPTRMLQVDDLLHPFKIRFEGEIGEDLGGLTTEMYQKFFQQIVMEQVHLFECGSPSAQGKLYHLPIPYFKVASNYSKSEYIKSMETIGKVIAKSILDQRCIPEVFSPFLFKYLLQQETIQVTFRDLEVFDSQMAIQFNRMIVETNIHEWDLSFDEIDSNNTTQVTDENKMEYLKRKLEHYLLETRVEALQAIKRGFDSLEEIVFQIRPFKLEELLILIHGNEFLEVQQIQHLFSFQDFSNDSPTPQHFLAILFTFSTAQLRKFLEFVTGSATIHQQMLQSNSLITIRAVRPTNMELLPVAHVCSFTLDLPDYRNEQILQSKLLVAMENFNSGFHIV